MTILLKRFLHYRVLEKGKGGRKSIRKRWEKRAPQKRWREGPVIDGGKGLS